MSHNNPQHDAQIKALEGRLKTLGDKLSGFNAHAQQINDLLPIIHRPGWTTPAEILLVSGLVESLLQHSQILDATHAALIRGASAVGKN